MSDQPQTPGEGCERCAATLSALRRSIEYREGLEIELRETRTALADCRVGRRAAWRGRVAALLTSKTVWGAAAAAAAWLQQQPRISATEIVQACGMVLAAIGVRDAFAQRSVAGGK
jgi:hypothetical protein